MRETTSDDVAIVLVGNKSDMTQERAVSEEDGRRKAESLGAEYLETSTKDNLNIKETFELLLDSMMPKEVETGRKTQTVETAVNLEDSQNLDVSQNQDCFQC